MFQIFDLTPVDEEEVKAIKTSPYLNLAQCPKWKQPDQAINQCTFALENDPRSAKAYYRRAVARESKKLYEEALEDATNAQAEMVVPDKGANASGDEIEEDTCSRKEEGEGDVGWGFWWCQEKKKA